MRPSLRLGIQQELQHNGGEVRTAHSLAAALRLVQSENPSAAIDDMGMQDGDAGEICAVLEARGNLLFCIAGACIAATPGTRPQLSPNPSVPANWPARCAAP
jgi:CheY-like chemotaxis protein